MQILYEDNHLIVVNKAAGELVQGDKTGDLPLAEKVKSYVKEKYGKPGGVFLGVVHRLDRPTSGVLVFARTSKALMRLNLQFHNRIAKKTYWALVSDLFKKTEGTLTHWTLRNHKANKSKAYENPVPGAKEAVLHFKKIKTLHHYCLLEIKLETGRHHQIRAQLCAIGFPIKGDLKYNAKRSNTDGSICLHARQLTIEHPVTKRKLCFKADPPANSLWNDALSC